MKPYILKLKTIFGRETSFFLETIHDHARRVIASDVLQVVCSPLINLFISAFIWRTTHSFVGVAAWNIGRHFFNPFIFYINGYLLRHIKIQSLFLIGSIVAGLSSLIVVVFKSSSPVILFLYGGIYSLGYGFYWANRNYLDFQETVSDGRQYFYSILSSVWGVSSVIVPFFAGWLIVLGRYTGWYTGQHAYWLLFSIGFALMVSAGIIIYQGDFVSPVPELVSQFRNWTLSARRVLSLLYGIVDGINFVSPLLILSLIGNEGALGTITAIVSVIVIILTYLYGRTFNQKHQYKTLVASCLMFFVCAFALAAYPGATSATIYIVCMGIASTFFNLAFSPISLGLTEKDMNGDIETRYSFIVDNETFLNIGRLAAIGIMFFIATEFAGSELSLTPIVVTSLQLLLLVLFFRIKRITTVA